MQVLFAVHSFATSMSKDFKNIFIAILLLLSSSSVLFAHNFSKHAYSLEYHDIGNALPAVLHLDLNFNQFSQKNAPLEKSFFIHDLFFDSSEEDAERLDKYDRNGAKYATSCCHFKQQLVFISVLTLSSGVSQSPTFFQSKTASSLYLLFEVFRI